MPRSPEGSRDLERVGQDAVSGTADPLIGEPERAPRTNELQERLDALVAERNGLREALDEPIYEWSFSTLLLIARQLLETKYPEEVFNGSSGDPGPVFVAKLREALKSVP